MPVIRTGGQRSGTFLSIYLIHKTSDRDKPVDILRREWGHDAQQVMTGAIPFLAMIGPPSVNKWHSDKWRLYYDSPWEATAELLGGANNLSLTANEQSRGWWYLAISTILGPFGYLFLI